MTFSEALESLKAGAHISREGWNGKGMFVFLNPGSKVTVSQGRPLAAALPVGTPVEMLPYIMMFTAQGNCVPWLASQTDILANDWLAEPIDKGGK